MIFNWGFKSIGSNRLNLVGYLVTFIYTDIASLFCSSNPAKVFAHSEMNCLIS